MFFKKQFNVGKRIVGEGMPVYIIAEAGVNHNGDLATAKEMILMAKQCNADAVKFQTFIADDLAHSSAISAEYQRTQSDGDKQVEMLRRYQLSFNQFEELKKCADETGIQFLSTPYDFKSLEFLLKLNVPVFKISSGELTNLSFIKKTAEFGKPIFLSTGMADIDEIKVVVDEIKKTNNQRLALLHCCTQYPAAPKNLNLKAIKTIKETFSLSVGFSDHSLGCYAPVAAVSLGACIIEKHFTLDKKMEGPDHKASIEIDELAEMVKLIRLTELSLGSGNKVPGKEETSIRKYVRKSIFSKTYIHKDEIITIEMLTTKRPATGIEAKFLWDVVGKKAKQNIPADTKINWDMLE